MSNSPKQQAEPNSSNGANAEVDATKEYVYGIPEEMCERMVRCDLMDGTVEVRVALLTLCKHFLNLWQDTTISSGTELVFPATQIKKKTFNLVVEWLTKQIFEQKQIGQSDIKKNKNGERIALPLNDFQRKFFDDLDFTSHAELINVADYLDISSLYHLGCMTMADRLKTMSEQEIRDNFGHPDDLTQKQKKEIRNLNVWCHYE